MWSAALQYKFSYAEKLHLQKDFQRVLKKGRRLAHPAIFIYTGESPEASQLRRLGLITSRKLGNAVKRNKVKRRLREIFRLHKHLLKPGTDVIFIPRHAAVRSSYDELSTVVLSLWRTAGIIA